MLLVRILPWILILSSALFMLSWSFPAQAAEPYLRLCKNGVIYYYYAHSNDKLKKPSFKADRHLTATPRPARKIAMHELELLIQEAGTSHSIPPSLIKAVICVESNFNPNATSPKGAQGLMQLMPATADHLQVADPYNLQENVRGGVKYLRMLLDKFDNRLPLALAAYNAGPKRVDQRQAVPPIPETQGFVRQVCSKFLEYAGQADAPIK
jgi:soluble lytic murein transglycosylase-like protein